jgi:hypothetical protein
MDRAGAPRMFVDLPLLKEAVDDLDRIATDLEAEVPNWSRARINDAVLDPGADPVSLQLGANMRTMAERAGVWLAEYAAQVRAAHGALQAQYESYRRRDDEIARSMRA